MFLVSPQFVSFRKSRFHQKTPLSLQAWPADGVEPITTALEAQQRGFIRLPDLPASGAEKPMSATPTPQGLEPSTTSMGPTLSALPPRDITSSAPLPHHGESVDPSAAPMALQCRLSHATLPTAPLRPMGPVQPPDGRDTEPAGLTRGHDGLRQGQAAPTRGSGRSGSGPLLQFGCGTGKGGKKAVAQIRVSARTRPADASPHLGSITANAARAALRRASLRTAHVCAPRTTRNPQTAVGPQVGAGMAIQATAGSGPFAGARRTIVIPRAALTPGAGVGVQTQAEPRARSGVKTQARPASSIGKGRVHTPGNCNHCGSQTSIKWRSGPREKPQLCNACGIRWKKRHTLECVSPPRPVARIPVIAVRFFFLLSF